MSRRGSSTEPKRNWLLAILATVLLVVGIGAWYIYNTFFINYAKSEAKRIESALEKNGGHKVCEQGDGGHGPDNIRPSYTALYEMPGDQQQAVENLKKIAKDNGYTLTDTSYRVNAEGSLHYGDESSKKSQYKELREGSVDLGFVVYKNKGYAGDNSTCAVSEQTPPQIGKSTVSFSLNLPEYKR